MSAPPFLTDILRRDPEQDFPPRFPFEFPWLWGFPLTLRAPVTFFVGENGTGKSTLLEALADLCDLPVSGGGTTELETQHGPETSSPLAEALRVRFTKHPRDRYFFRAEFLAHFASLLEERSRDPDFLADPFAHYGGRSLHARSHGEAFLALMNHRLHAGLFLLDEPESALSPQRQLTLLALMSQRVAGGKSQFIVATHSPILLTYPGAHIVSLDEASLRRVPLEETSHFVLTRDILNCPERYWQHLSDKSRRDRGEMTPGEE